MSQKQEGTPSPFDLGQLKELFEMMEKHGLTEVSLQQGEQKWRMRRGPEQIAMPNWAPMMSAPAPMQAAPAPAATTPSVPAAAAPAASNANDGLVPIKSPTVGTFYSSSNPDEPPFVKVGDAVKSDQTVCLIEAMKVFNQIPAEMSGTIAKILVKNGDTVEFGQPLFMVKPA